MSLIGGIRPPIAVLSVLLLALAGITALTLGRAGQEAVPKAVKSSQQHFAEDGAIALRASIDESVTDLTRTAELFSAGDPVPADAVLDKIGSVYQKWMGTAVVEISSGKLLAARGENLPLTAVDRGKLADKDGLDPRMVRLENGETRLLSFALLTWKGEPQQLLVASSSLRFPGISLGTSRSIAVVSHDGSVLSQDGIPEPEQVGDDRREEIKRSEEQLKTFATSAAKKTREHPIMSKEPGSGGFAGVSGHLTGEGQNGKRAVAGYASLAAPEAGETTMATELGLSVVAMVPVTEDRTATHSSAFGLFAAAALLLIGGVTVFLLLRTVQRPLIQLFLEGRRLTRGDLERPVSVPRSGEAARIGVALERLRRQLLGAPADQQGSPARRGKRGSRTLLAVCAVLLLAWSAPLMLLLNRAGGGVDIPQQMVADQRERTDTLTDRVRRALNEGHADLTSVATLIGDRTEAADMTKVLEGTLHQHTRYQSLYVLDASGKVLAEAGDDPRSPAGEGASTQPVRVIDEGGKKPVILGTAEVPGRKGAAVVGEFRIEFLNSLLGRPGLGEVRVVDDKRRVIGANTGYREFQDLPGGRITELAKSVAGKGVEKPRAEGALHRDGGDVRIAAAAPFAGGGVAQALNWTVVTWQPASGLAIPEYSLQNRTVLAGLLGITAAAACLGWLHIVVVRPLRHLADQAEALADGDRRTVLYPRHHDEVGAVTRSLELIRQQLPTGTQRKRDGVTAGLAGRN